LRTAAALGLVLCLSADARAQRAPFKIPDPDPEVERQSFIVADGSAVTRNELTP
jgi:hypothetical protein